MPLLKRRCPPTVAGLVIAVVVDSIDGVLRNARSHVRVEALKSVPAFADPNATTPVPILSRIFSIFTALYHQRPDAIFGRSALMTVASVSVSSMNEAVDAPSVASAGKDQAAVDILKIDVLDDITIAPEGSDSPAVTRGPELKQRKLMEPCSDIKQL